MEQARLYSLKGLYSEFLDLFKLVVILRKIIIHERLLYDKKLICVKMYHEDNRLWIQIRKNEGVEGN